MSHTTTSSSDYGPRLPWLDRWASALPTHQWQPHIYTTSTAAGRSTRTLYHRELGLVERSFDSDGRYHEGRADANVELHAAVHIAGARTASRSAEDNERAVDAALRERILRAWTVLRLHHPMLRARVATGATLLGDGNAQGASAADDDDLRFAIEQPTDAAELVREAADTLVFVGDHYATVDADDFFLHSQNTARIFDPAVLLAKLFVLPFERGEAAVPGEHRRLRLLLLAGHEITEGLAQTHWLAHLLTLLNGPAAPLSDAALARDASAIFASPAAVAARFPLAQETLYPPIRGTAARRRWFWAISLAMRHARRPGAQGFANPLRRAAPRPYGAAVPLPPTFSAIFDYSRTPPRNTYLTGVVRLSARATARVHALCRRVGASIGAGTFALAALAAMQLHEAREPDVPLPRRAPFVAGFPLNARGLFGHTAPPDSVMLAFSYGMALPFLPARLPVEGRFALLARAAHRQLRQYKRREPPPAGAGAGAAPRARPTDDDVALDPVRVLAANHLMAVERSAANLPAALRAVQVAKGVAEPQGALVASPRPAMTHGVTAIGMIDGALSVGAFPLPAVEDGGGDGLAEVKFTVDFRKIRPGPRIRDDEFLLGTAGDDQGLWLSASYDGNAIDEDLVEEWKRVVAGLLEPGEGDAGEAAGRKEKL